MSRLILVPQYPTDLRYQEWWFTELPKNYAQYFDEVIVLGKTYFESLTKFPQKLIDQFAPIQRSIEFEVQQIKEYLTLILKEDDILLLCDISFPGLFANVLYHTRPGRCFAICHATSKNRYDYFAKDEHSKWNVENGVASLFNAIFVATYYHRDKLKWSNTIVTGLPLPPEGLGKQKDKFLRFRPIVSVARDNIQKRNKVIEKVVEKEFGSIYSSLGTEIKSWTDYYEFLSQSKVMLITSREETFGYQVVDALLNDCIPIAPNKYSYPELLPSSYLYNTVDELIEILSQSLDGKLPVPKLLTEGKCKNFYNTTAEIMRRSIIK